MKALSTGIVETPSGEFQASWDGWLGGGKPKVHKYLGTFKTLEEAMDARKSFSKSVRESKKKQNGKFN